jgi:hypothetical protein
VAADFASPKLAGWERTGCSASAGRLDASTAAMIAATRTALNIVVPRHRVNSPRSVYIGPTHSSSRWARGRPETAGLELRHDGIGRIAEVHRQGDMVAEELLVQEAIVGHPGEDVDEADPRSR